MTDKFPAENEEPRSDAPAEPAPPGDENEAPDDGQNYGNLWRLLNEGEGTESSATEAPPKKKAPAPRPKFEEADSKPDGFEDVDIDEEKKAAAAVPSVSEVLRDQDYDPAIISYRQQEELVIKCKKFPEKDAVAQCPVCEAYFSQEWLTVYKGKLVCRDCVEELRVRSEDEILSEWEGEDSGKDPDFIEEDKPEFQVYGTSFGMEGHVATPVKKLLALVLDLILVRGLVLLALFSVDALPFLSVQEGIANSPLFQLFEPGDGFDSPEMRIFKAMILLSPILPWLPMFFVIDFIYYFTSLAFWNRTWGMTWLGCRIVSEYGDFVTFGAVALRVLVYLVMFGMPAIIVSWFFPGFRGPHDYAAGTLVINYAGVKRIDAYESVRIKI